MFSNWDALNLGMCQVYWERESQKRDLRREISEESAPESCAKRVGKSRSQEAGNSSGRQVEEVEQSPGSRNTGSQVSTVLVLVV